MIKINRIEKGDLIYYEALFVGGNLYAYCISDLVSQLVSIYRFEISLFNFSKN